MPGQGPTPPRWLPQPLPDQDRLAGVHLHGVSYFTGQLVLELLHRQLELPGIHLLRLLPEKTPAQHIQLVLQGRDLPLRFQELLLKARDESLGGWEVLWLRKRIGLGNHSRRI
jgi:hypothetical protein